MKRQTIAKFVTLALVALMLVLAFSINAFAITDATASTSASKTQLNRGDEITVTVKINNASGVGAIMITPEYDSSVFELTGGEWLIAGTGNFNGVDGVIFTSSTDVNGNAFKFTLKVKDNAIFGNYNVCAEVIFQGSANRTITPKTSVQISCTRHSYTSQALTYQASAATCKAAAKYYYCCEYCGAKGTSTFSYGDLAPHDFSKQVIQNNYKLSDATCTDKAVYFYCCQNCNASGGKEHTYEYGNTIAHSYTRKVIDDAYLKTPAGCTTKAVYYYCCATCDKADTQKTFEYGDSIGGGHTGGTATCTAQAICTRCGQPYGNKLNHSYTDEDVADEYLKSAANCTSPAVYYKNCATCDQRGTATFTYGTPSDHNFSKQVTSNTYKKSDATCTNKAVYYYCCTGCSTKGGDENTYEYGNTISHSYTNKVTTAAYLATPAGCTTKAVYYYCCATCDAKGAQTYEYGDTLGGHTGGTATCTAQAICDNCGQSYGNKLSHSYTDEDVADEYLKSAANCTSPAVYYKNCATCDQRGTATFTYGTSADHDFSKQIIRETYMRNSATCTTKAVYYYCCTGCSTRGGEDYTYEYGDTLPHSYTKQVTTDAYLATPAGCVTKAVYYYSCATCDAFGTRTYQYGDTLGGHTGGTATCSAKAVCDRCYQEYGSVRDHVYTDEDVADEYFKSAANCTSPALYYKNCATCDKKGTDTFEYGYATDHNFSNKVINNNYKKSSATCASGAVYYYCCTGCTTKSGDDRTFVYGDAIDHSYTKRVTTDAYLVTPAGCTTNAVYYYCCATCDLMDTSKTYEHGNSLGGHTGGEATCTAQAVCERCGESYGSRLNHMYTDEDVTPEYLKSAASCTSPAVYYKNCATCDQTSSVTFTYGEALPHTYIENAESRYLKTSASCIAKAVYYKSCSECGIKGSETFEYGDDPSHNYLTHWSSNSESHWHQCSRCGDKTDVAAHIPGAPATTTTAETCTVCNYVITPASGHTHDYVYSWVSDVNGHWYACASCGHKRTEGEHVYDNACDTDCNICGYVRVAEHIYSFDWVSDGKQHWYECSCGEKTSVYEHIGGTATCEEKAKCLVCQAEYGKLAEHKYSEATCTAKAKCSVCGDEKGTLLAHVYVDGKCACGAIDPNYVTEDENGEENNEPGQIPDDNAGNVPTIVVPTDEPKNDNTAAVIAIVVSVVVVVGGGVAAVVVLIKTGKISLPTMKPAPEKVEQPQNVPEETADKSNEENSISSEEEPKE